MMSTTHRATGLCAGACLAWSARVAFVPEPVPFPEVISVLGAAVVFTVVCGWASLWPDLDHSSSSATRSYGWVSRVVHEIVEGLSIACFDLTATRADREAGDFRNHRGLTHFAVSAAVFAAGLGVLVAWVASRWPVAVWAAAIGLATGSVSSRVVAGAIWAGAVRRTRRRVLREAVPVVVTVLGGGFAARWLAESGSFSPDAATAIGVATAVAVMAGMLAHDLGDAATVTGVPLLWPLVIRGRRYFPVHVRPRGMRGRTGASSPLERRVRIYARVLGVLAVIGWVPGSWTAIVSLSLTPLGVTFQ